jgi:hypothetical protein
MQEVPGTESRVLFWEDTAGDLEITDHVNHEDGSPTTMIHIGDVPHLIKCLVDWMKDHPIQGPYEKTMELLGIK